PTQTTIPRPPPPPPPPPAPPPPPPPGGGWETVIEVSITSARFDELGHDFERDRPVVRGKVGAADVRLFPVADAVAYAERWLPLHRSREEEMATGADPAPARRSRAPRT
ncbi:AAC(3) family N-acetyltransferase, partial [Streptomyces sp. NPDC001759]